MALRKHSPRVLPPVEDIRPPAPEVARALAFTGIFSRVAVRIGRSSNHVLEVAKGRRQSKPVIDAIVEEVRQIDSKTRRGRAA